MRQLLDLRFLAAVAIGLLLIQSNGRAQLKVWDNAGTASWFDDNNWSPTGKPTASNSVQINNGGTAQIAQAGGQALGVTLGQTASTSGTLEISGAGVLTLPANDLTYIGYIGSGTLNISGGGQFNSYRGYLGVNAASSKGTANIDGGGSKWSITNDLVVGRLGEGKLNLTNGGNVSVGHTVTVAQTVDIGTVSIDAATLTLAAGGQFQLGSSGTGTLNVTNGGILSSDTSVIGIFTGAADSHATITGNSKWSNTGFFGVGYNVNGLLDIQNGGQASDSIGYAGMFTGSTGTVNVTGTNSKWTSSDSLYIGGIATAAGGTGQLNISNGGLVTAATTLKLWNGSIQQSGTARLAVSNNPVTLLDTGGVYVGSSGGTGTLQMVGTSVLRASTLDIGTSGTLTQQDTSRLVVSSDPTYLPTGAGLVVGKAIGSAYADGTVNVTGTLSTTAGLLTGLGSQIKVAGPNSRWTIGGALNIATDYIITGVAGGTLTV